MAHAPDSIHPRIRLARNLRRAREAANGGHGLSQVTVAEQLGVTRQTVNRDESERDDAPNPDEARLEQYATLYGTTVAELRYGGGNAVSPRGIQGVQAVREGEPSREIRAYLYTFAGHLAGLGAADDEIARARALLMAPEAAEFFGGTQAAIEQLAPIVEQELARRHASENPLSQLRVAEDIVVPRGVDPGAVLAARGGTKKPAAKKGRRAGGAR